MAFRDIVTLRNDSRTDNDPQPNYSGSALVEGLHADIVAVGGGEQIRGRQLDAQVNYVVQIRYRSDVTYQTRVEVTGGPFSGRTLNVTRIIHRRDHGRPPMLDLDCVEAR